MDDELQLLFDALATYSPSTEERAVGELLVARMRALGFRAELDDAGNAVGEIVAGPGEGGAAPRPEILLVGHMDTVPGFIRPAVRDGNLHGRGAVDAKGPLVAFICAAARLARPDSNRSPAGDAADSGSRQAGWRGRVVVVGCVEEECATSKGARYLVDRYRPDYCLIGEPSGWSSLTLGYKGRLLIDYRLELPVKHTAAPGASAAERVVDFWLALRELARGRSAGRRAFDALDASLRRIGSGGDGFVEWAELLAGFRLPTDLTVEELKAQVAALADPAARLAFSSEEPAFRAGKSNALVRAFLGAIRAAGGEPTFKVKTGTSDMNILGPAWGCPILAYGPGDSSLDHTPEEHVPIEEWRRGVDVLERALRTLLQP